MEKTSTLTKEQTDLMYNLLSRLEDTHMYAYEAPYKYTATYETKLSFKIAKSKFFTLYRSLTKQQKEELLDYNYNGNSVRHLLEQELFINIF